MCHLAAAKCLCATHLVPLCDPQVGNNRKGLKRGFQTHSLKTPGLEDLNCAECRLFLWCLSIGHIQYLSFCRSLTSSILRNRVPIVEKSIQIILMMKNTVNSTVKYIILQFKIAVFYADI